MPDITELTAQMTLAEKAALVSGASFWTTTPVERLGIPALLVSDGPHGVRRIVDLHQAADASLPATCFPSASALAATWDGALLQAMGQALAAEARALGVNVLLGPGINMKRSPLCGRNFEYFSEDPYLAGKLAAALIDGIQSAGVGTSLKHFAANNQEFERFSISAEIDERTLREIYLSAFEIAVREAQPWSVMCAYNRLNGTYGSENGRLLTDILRGEWGFDGFVVSDWGAVHDRVAALQAGLDLEMPGPKPRRTQAVIDAVNAGTLDVAQLDTAVGRILRIVQRAAATPAADSFDADAHHALARRVAAASMVLLKNDGILPLQAPASLAIIGRAAKVPHFQGGGSSYINPTRVDVPYDAIAALAGDATLHYADGYPADDTFDQALIDAAVATAQAAEVALLCLALPASKESEGYDRADLDLTAQQVALIRAVTAVQPRTVVILHNGAAVAVGDWIDGTAALLEAWMMGQAGGGAVADILFGHVNPAGKLAETFPRRLCDTPAYTHFPGENGRVRYGEGLFIGYRHYDMRDIAVQFPFGHGLSYTTFAYANARASAARFRAADGVSLHVDITNTGALAGAEVVQLYVHDRQARLQRPVKELKRFAKVMLQPGETQTVTFDLDRRAFAYYDPAYGRWVAEAGEFELLVGASAGDIRARVAVELIASEQLPSLLTADSTLRAWQHDPRGAAALAPLLAHLRAHGRLFSHSDDAAIGMDMDRFLLDIPLVSVLHFEEHALEAAPEAIVAALLREVSGVFG